jgi:glycosyltransferase involved in cell wall biosynthesis
MPHPKVLYVVVSQSRREELAGLFGWPTERIKVIYNGVDPVSLLGLSSESYRLAQRLGLFESDLVLLMPVRVTQAKNTEYALRLVRALKASGLRPVLLVTGPPDPHDEGSMAYFNGLLGLRGDLGVEKEVHFIYCAGPDPEEPFLLDANTVSEIYRLSDVMLMPSHREGFGMPVLEAGLLGIQVITTGVPAAVEIGGEDVFHFDHAEEPDQLARRIIEWASHNAAYRLRKRIRQRYTWQAIFRRQIEPLFEL